MEFFLIVVAFVIGLMLGVKIQKNIAKNSQPQNETELNTVDYYIENPNFTAEPQVTAERLIYNLAKDQTQIVVNRNKDGVLVSGIARIEKVLNKREIYTLDKEYKFVPWNIFLTEYAPSSMCPIMINPNYGKKETISVPKIEDIELLDQEITKLQLENK